MVESAFLKKFSRHIFFEHGTKTRAAEHWNVSPAFVSSVANGTKRPNKKMLEDMGLELVIERKYVKVKV